MSFFGGSGFDDPFFGHIHRMMRDQMREFDNLMADPFGIGLPANQGRQRTPRQQMIDDDHPSDANPRRGSGRSAMVPRDPFDSGMETYGMGFGVGMFSGMLHRMNQMQNQAVNDPSSHVFSQSTVISMRPGQNGRPEIVEKTESVRKAGNVKETRRTLRDTERGVEEMRIGHHIGSRGHVIEKRRDRATGGQILENQEFIGLKEDEAETFDREFSRATRGAMSSGGYFLDEESNAGPHLAIEDSKSRRRNRLASPYKSPSQKDQKPRRQPKQTVRVEEPEDEEPKKSNKKGRKGGPKIVEIEEVDLE